MKSLSRTLPRLTCAGLTLLGGLALCRAQDAPPEPPDANAYALAPRYAKGQTNRYQTQTLINLRFQSDDATRANLQLSATMNVVMRYLVKEMKSDGTVQMSALNDGGTLVDAANQAIQVPKDPDNYPRLATFDKYNNLTALKDSGKKKEEGPLDGLFNQSNLLAHLHFLPLPDRPVKVGDTWESRVPLPGAKSEPKTEPDANAADKDKAPEQDASAIRVKVTLLGRDRLDAALESTKDANGIETLKFKQVVSIPFEALTDAEGKTITDAQKAAGRIQTRMVFTQVVHAQPQTGAILKSIGELSGEIQFSGAVAKQVPGEKMKMDGKVAVLRLAAERGSQKR